MGLTPWKGAVVRKADVTVAKNYLREPEITELNRLVSMFLDFAEDNARRRRQVFLKDWRERLDQFLEFHEREVLPDAGSVSREEADAKVHREFAKFGERRRQVEEEEGLRQLEDVGRQAESARRAGGSHATETGRGSPPRPRGRKSRPKPM